MDKKWIIGLTLLACLALVGIVWAQTSPNYDNSWHVLGAGGNQGMSSGEHAIHSTSGQLAIGPASSDQTFLGSGYWYGIQPLFACVDVEAVTLTLVTSGTLHPGDLVEFSADLAPDEANPPFNYRATLDGAPGDVLSATLEPLVLTTTFATTGSHTVELAVWNCQMGEPEALTDSLEVQVYAPDVCVELESIAILGPSQGPPGEYTFDTEYTPTNATLPISYTWDDGGTDPSSTRTLEVGVRTVAVSATNCVTVTVSASHTITITEPPTCTQVGGVELSLVTTGTIYAGDTADFQANIAPDGFTPPYTYVVYVDQTATLPATSSDDPLDFSHTFPDTGTFSVEIRVWNCDMGEADAMTDSIQVTVYEPGACVDVTGVELSLLTVGDIYPGDQVDLAADLSPDGASLPYSYTLDYGDGTAPVTDSSSDDPFNFSHTYANTGTFIVAFAAWNCEMTLPVSDSLQVTVQTPPQEGHTVYLPIITRSD